MRLRKQRHTVEIRDRETGHLWVERNVPARSNRQAKKRAAKRNAVRRAGGR